MTTHLLKARGVRKAYDDLVAVSDLDLDLQAGECLALLGPNGAGKTTTCEILEGLLPADSGEIVICGHPAHEREQILELLGVQLQESNLYRKYTVGETLALFASFYKRSLPPQDLLRQLQLEEKVNTRLEKLSGGQRQRVYLACALINDPKLLFLDEPTTGLDPQARRYIWQLLLEMKGGQRGILLTTHSMEEAEVLADKVAIMDRGKLIAQGTLDSLLAAHCQQDVLRFSMATGDQERLRGKLPWLPEASSSQVELNIADASTKLQDLVRAAVQEGLTLDSLGIRKSTLEDVFLKLTGRSLRDA